MIRKLSEGVKKFSTLKVNPTWIDNGGNLYPITEELTNISIGGSGDCLLGRGCLNIIDQDNYTFNLEQGSPTKSPARGNTLFSEVTESTDGDFLTGGTATSNYSLLTSTPAMAVDDDTGTSWGHPNVDFLVPVWWKYDLGSGVTKMLRIFKIYIGNSSGAKSIIIQGSNDDSLYTQITGLTVADTYGSYQTFYTPNDTAYRYYRIYVYSNHSGVDGLFVNEFQMIEAYAELRVLNEAGTYTTLSPHNFSLAPKSESMAWSHYSKKGNKEINVDMLKAIRILEKLSGEKLVYET